MITFDNDTDIYDNVINFKSEEGIDSSEIAPVKIPIKITYFTDKYICL